ncbi:MAG: hypothetical protein ACKO5Y_00815 [Bacteroidota bacterium]
MKTLRLTLFTLTSALILAQCTREAENSNSNAVISSSGKSPVVVIGENNGGNVTCDEAAVANGVSGFSNTTGKIDYPFTSDSFGENVTVNTDGTYVSWSITPPAGYCVTDVAVIVKGGPAANVYYYNNGISSDSGLASPINASGNPAGLSNLTICYNLTPCAVACNWQEETAFGGSVAGEGNAWWYALDANQSGTYPIYAGQNPIEGASVYYNAETDFITINLGNSMQLQNVQEPVKVEGYTTLPNERPTAGLFQLYKGTSLTVQGNGSNYYVVHLDVEVCN